MSKKTVSILILTNIILSACGTQAPQVTETPIVAPPTIALPATNPAVETDAPVTDDAPTPTPTEVPPDNPPDCVNKAAFVSDITIPDNTEVNTGEAFTKTWRIQNTGTCIWWSGYTLSHYSDESMSAPNSVPLPRTNPGETADISVDLVAPSVAGTYRGNFVVKNAADLIMQVDNDSRLWLIINVKSAPTAVPTTDGGSGSVNAACDVTLDDAKTSVMLTALTAYRAQNSLGVLSTVGG